jgi:hypothetical protein
MYPNSPLLPYSTSVVRPKRKLRAWQVADYIVTALLLGGAPLVVGALSAFFLFINVVYGGVLQPNAGLLVGLGGAVLVVLLGWAVAVWLWTKRLPAFPLAIAVCFLGIVLWNYGMRAMTFDPEAS